MVNLKRIDSFEDWPGESCYNCGRRNNVGFEVNDNIWEQVVGDPDIVFCPTCFDVLAQKKQIVYSFNRHIIISWNEWK